MSDMCQRSVHAEICRAAPAAALEKCFRLKSVVIDFVTPDGAPELSHDILLASNGVAQKPSHSAQNTIPSIVTVRG